MRRLSIPTRIFLAFALVLSSFGVVSVSSLLQHASTSSRLRLLSQGYLPLAFPLGKARDQHAIDRQRLDAVMEGSAWVRLTLMARVRQARPATMRRLAARLETAERLAAEVGEPHSLDSVREALTRVQQAHELTHDRYEQLFAALERDDSAAAEELVRQLSTREQSVTWHFDRADRQLQERIEAVGAMASEQERQASFALAILSALALVVGLLATWWSQSVLKPLPSLQERVAAVARGDLSPLATPPRGDDELGRLAQDFEAMVEALAARDRHLAELRHMQEQIVTGLRAAVVVVGAEDEALVANPAAALVLEVETGSPDAFAELCRRIPELRAAVEAVRNGAPSSSLEASALGSRRVDVLVLPFGNQGDHVLLVAHDVTEALATKQRLIQTERLAAIGRMAAHVTHEVRNPLSSIGLNVELLEDELEQTNDEAKSLMRAIQKEIDRLTAITEEYLRLARLPQPRLEPEDLGELLRAITSFIEHELTSHGVELHLDIEELPLVAVDEAQLRQAMLNLVRNAREAMPGGGPLFVSARRDGDGVLLSVEDRGEGIPEARRSQVFDLFYSTKERGTGLGLPLTQQIVVAHGGQIRCDAAPGGVGTRFEIHLPSAEPATGGSEPPRGSIRDELHGMTRAHDTT